MTTDLNSKFWSNFSKKYWEKKPLALKNIKSPVVAIGEAEIFELLILFSNKCRKMDDPAGFKFYIDGEQISKMDVLQILPISNDKNLLGYHERMNKMFSDYCLVCDELLQVSTKYKDHILEFTNSLYQHVGFPNQFAEIGLYLGNYKKTPFGVHVDSCGVFSFPIVGQKKFRLWTTEFVNKNPKLDRAFEYSKYKKSSEIVSARVGDMTYWPSTSYHIAESDGQFSATWSLGVWIDKSFQKTFSENFEELLGQESISTINKPMTELKKMPLASGEVLDLPESYSRSIQALKNLTSTELQDHFLKCWMKHLSLEGFKKKIQTDFEKLTLKSKIKIPNLKTKIIWKKSFANKNIIYVAYQGNFLEISKTSGLFNLILDLNKGVICQISHYLKPAELKILNKSNLRFP